MGCPDFWDTLVFTLQSETQKCIVMIAKKYFSMDVLIDLAMTKLFLLAEYLCDKTSPACGREMRPQTVESIPSKDIMPTIRFSNEDKMVEGDLFKQPEAVTPCVESGQY